MTEKSLHINRDEFDDMITTPTDDKQKRKQSPAEEAAKEILELTSDRIISTADISHLHCEVSAVCLQDIVEIIDAFLTAERAEAVVTLELNDRMAEFVVFMYDRADFNEEAELERLGIIKEVEGFSGFGYVISSEITEAAIRHKESEK